MEVNLESLFVQYFLRRPKISIPLAKSVISSLTLCGASTGERWPEEVIVTSLEPGITSQIPVSKCDMAQPSPSRRREPEPEYQSSLPVPRCLLPWQTVAKRL